MTMKLMLRKIVDEDLTVFFEQQSDPEAKHMAAFTAEDPVDREAFINRWKRILADPTVIGRTVVRDGQALGHVLSYEEAGKPEVTYWIGRAYWGKGVASWALKTFLAEVNRTRPIYARVARDNLSSIRVLEKCGFKQVGEARGFANARRREIEELVFELAETTAI